MPGRGRSDDEPLFDADGFAFLERLREDCSAFAGIDARAPMRRDVGRALRVEDAGDDDC